MQPDEPPWILRDDGKIEPDGSSTPSRRQQSDSDLSRPTETLNEDSHASAASGAGAHGVPPAGVPALFAPGDVVSERYRIRRFLARGGAGEVYEAQDEALGSRVALKAIRRDHTSAAAIARFKREINLARQVTHPNVCRIYEFGHQARPDGGLLFLTMEFLEGETLLERIHRGGPMKPEEALPVVRQMAAGLAAAQKAGVVHRDFKSGNVMLVPDPEEAGGVRAVITDFGLAKTASDVAGGAVDEGPKVTARDLMVGTPAYMAPEQVSGEAITSATDLYAFGVVLYEMSTGHTPFDADTGLATAVARLKETPPSPRLYTPDLDLRWEATILRCLEREPEDRWASAEAAAAALVAGAAGPADRHRPSRFGRPAALVLGVLGLALLLVAGWFLSRYDREPAARAQNVVEQTPAARLVPRRSLALLGFKNLSGDPRADWLSTALSEMLATEVAAGEGLRVVPGDDVARMKIELGLTATDALASDLLGRIGEILGSELAVVGSYLTAGAADAQEIRLDLRVQEMASGEVVAAISERGTEDLVLDLVESVGQKLRGALGAGDLTDDQAREVRASFPAGPGSARLYAEGLEKLRRYDAQAALELLEEAARLDGDNPLIRSALSAAWGSLGYQPRARQEARLAFDLAGDLSRRDRLWVEARYHDVAGDRRQAAKIYALLWDFFPDHLEYGLRLARAQTGIGMAEAALATVDKLRAMPATAGLDPRIDLAEAEAARALSRYDQQQSRAAEAAHKSAALGARLLAARAREIEAGAWRDLGKPDQALAAYAEAKAIYEQAENRGRVARILIAIAKIERHQGRFDEARRLIEETLAIAREVGDQGTIKHAVNTLAIILRQQGKLSEAREMHRMELAANREIGDRRSLAVSLTSLGVVERQMGDLEAARGRFSEALALGRESGSQRSVEINLNMLGEVLLRQGQPAAARRHFEEALAANSDTGSPRGRAYYLSSLAEVDYAVGDLATARRRLGEALDIRRSLGEQTNIAYSLLSLAAIDLEERLSGDAGEKLRQAAEEFRTESKTDAEGYALAELARALSAEGHTEDAATAIERAEALLAGSENRPYRLAVAIRAAEVEAARGGTAAARRRLAETIDEARSLGFVDLRLEAALALGEIELAAGAAGAGRLETVSSEAAELGFELIAGKARAILSGG